MCEAAPWSLKQRHTLAGTLTSSVQCLSRWTSAHVEHPLEDVGTSYRLRVHISTQPATRHGTVLSSLS